MSVSMNRSKVERLTKEIAGLEGKRAAELKTGAKERQEAIRLSSSISKGTSVSLTNSKLTSAARHEEKAADADKRASKVTEQLARKQRDLGSAQQDLTKALRREQQKEDRESENRRRAELSHIRDLETARRSAQAPVMVTPRSVAPLRSVQEGRSGGFDYDVCLSFAGEDRAYVEMVARGLRENGIKVFYDQDEQVKTWGKDLAEHLDWIYRVASRYCVVFISEAYARKPWTIHERRSALARALEEQDEYVLPARFDDTELPGLRPTVAYLDLRETAAATLIEHILEKLGRKAAWAQDHLSV